MDNVETVRTSVSYYLSITCQLVHLQLYANYMNTAIEILM